MNCARTLVAGLITGSALLSGCAALPDTTLGHKCGIPDGVGCMSTQEVYDRTQRGDLPGLERVNGGGTVPVQRRTPGGVYEPDVYSPTDAPRVIQTSALYAPPEELRIWVNRWRDKDGDLHDDSFMYVLIGEGQWLVRD